MIQTLSGMPSGQHGLCELSCLQKISHAAKKDRGADTCVQDDKGV